MQFRSRSRRSFTKQTSNECNEVHLVSKMSDDANALNQKLFVKKEETIKRKQTLISSKFRNFETANSDFYDRTNIETKRKIPITNRDIGFGFTGTGPLPRRGFRNENAYFAHVPSCTDQSKIFPNAIRYSNESERIKTILHFHLEREGRNEFAKPCHTNQM